MATHYLTVPGSSSTHKPGDRLQEQAAPCPSQPPFGRRWGRIFSLSSSLSQQPELVPLRPRQELAEATIRPFELPLLTQIVTNTYPPDQRLSEPSGEEIVDLYDDREEPREKPWHDEAASPGTCTHSDPPRKIVGSEVDKSQALFSSVQSILTTRGILFLKILQHQLGSARDSQPSNTPSGFDQRLTLGEAIKFADALDAHPELLSCESTWLKVCDMCHIPRFQGLGPPPFIDEAGLPPFLRSLHQSRDVFDEFHSSSLSPAPCCSQTICDSCYVQAVAESFARDYWHDLDSQCWLRCPSRTCPSRLPIRYNVELAGMLRSLGDPQAIDHGVQYERASRYRAALGALEPRPTAAALQRAAELHAHLHLHGRMKNSLDPHQPLDVKIDVLPVDSADGSEVLQVPIFVDLIVPSQSSSNGRDCIVCAETLPDITDGTPEEEARWAATISDFPGDWTHLVRPFMPPSSLPACSAEHDLDICRACLSRHLEAQLESRGRAVSESLTCPSLGCGHLYTHSELRIVASPETFARYDKLRLLSHLATLPDFRWCLREGCGSGQVYAFPASRLPSFPADMQLRQRNRVLCEACGFAMCFAHQTPWHEGLDCVEYDAERGDPQLAATRAWICDNTKGCPGCEAPVEKGPGCFHMTCHVCHFEFCWECLADWAQIVNVHPITYVRKYRRDRHAVGCYFRSENAPEATMVAGHTVQEALW